MDEQLKEHVLDSNYKENRKSEDTEAVVFRQEEGESLRKESKKQNW